MGAPSLEFDWEVGAFRALRAMWRWFAPAAPAWDAERAARLEDHLGSLQPLAQLVAGKPVKLLPARTGGGVRGLDLLLPVAIDLAPDPEANRALYVLRAVHAATIVRLGLAVDPPKEAGERLRRELEVADRAASVLREEMLSFGAAWDEACGLVLSRRPDLGTLRGRALQIEQVRRAALEGGRPWEDEALFRELARTSARGPESPAIALWGSLFAADATDLSTGAADEAEGQLPDGTEIEAPGVEDIRRVLLDPKAQEEKVLQHTFEKVETADSWQGNVMNDDGSDELEDQLEALEEVELGELLRGGQDAHSVYRADIGMGADIPDVETITSDERGIAYDEWDVNAGGYRKAWCTVYPSRIAVGRPGWAEAATQRHRRLIDRLQRQLEDQRAGLQVIDRQLDGEHPDIDALVDHLAEVKAGRTGAERLYLRSQPRRRDFATTVLLDVSLSADSWIDDRRVLDVARDAVLVLGEVCDHLDDRLEVLAFASSTRNRCRVWSIKGWGESWRVGRARLGVLEPQGYTRIGAALRHAALGLSRVQADARLLLLVSDGKPTDYDRYEGRYGVADVRMALREAERMGVRTHALAVDAIARSYLPPMLGPGRWHVLPTTDHLLPALTEVYGRLTAR